MEQRFESFTVLIAKISKNMRKIKNHEMLEYGLKSPHISCLYYLYLDERLTAKELCEKCEEDKATISRSLEYLEKNDYIACETTDKKRYKTPLALTEKGREIGKKIVDKVSFFLDEGGLGMTEEERAVFYRGLNTISENLERITKNHYRKEEHL